MQMVRGLAAWALAAAPVASSAHAASDEEPLIFKPSTPWTADFADDSCALRRTFENGKDTLILQIKKRGPEKTFELLVASPTLPYRASKPRIMFLPDEEFQEFNSVPPAGQRSTAAPFFKLHDGDLRGVSVTDSFLPNEIEQEGPANDESNLPDASADREAAITGVLVENVFARGVRIDTGSMEKPMFVMRGCIDDLVSRWGLDPAAQRERSRMVTVPEGEDWFRELGSRQARIVQRLRVELFTARILVDEKGKATACKLLELPADRDVVRELCDFVIRRGEFEPALDDGGRPIDSYILLPMFAWKV